MRLNVFEWSSAINAKYASGFVYFPHLIPWGFSCVLCVAAGPRGPTIIELDHKKPWEATFRIKPAAFLIPKCHSVTYTIFSKKGKEDYKARVDVNNVNQTQTINFEPGNHDVFVKATWISSNDKHGEMDSSVIHVAGKSNLLLLCSPR